jgi:hypothetical protein
MRKTVVLAAFQGKLKRLEKMDTETDCLLLLIISFDESEFELYTA